MSEFQGRTALVTGAASGIGAACVRWLTQRGIALLVLVDIDEAALERIAPPRAGCAYERFAGDIADPDLWRRVGARCDALDFAVLNAGIAQSTTITDIDLAQWRRVMAVNLDGTMLSLQYAMRAMIRYGGAIALTASTSGFKAEPGTAAYGASKAGVIQMAKIAAKEGAPLRIRVNAIAPGGVDTPIWDEVPMFRKLVDHTGDRSAAMAAMGAAGTALGRFASADEIAAQIGFLLSDAAATITGAVLVSDGGYSL